MGLSARVLGSLVALATLVVDQGHKHWMIYSFNIADRQPVNLFPGMDLVMAWNPGISYSWLSAETPTGRMALLGIALTATLILCVWLWRNPLKITGIALGFLIGGALGNAWDRYTYGAVADFFHFHVGSFSWYVFNLADVGIVAGVALLLYESFLPQDKDTSSLAK